LGEEKGFKLREETRKRGKKRTEILLRDGGKRGAHQQKGSRHEPEGSIKKE